MLSNWNSDQYRDPHNWYRFIKVTAVPLIEPERDIRLIGLEDHQLYDGSSCIRAKKPGYVKSLMEETGAARRIAAREAKAEAERVAANKKKYGAVIRKLRAKANDPAVTPEESKAFFAKADELAAR